VIYTLGDRAPVFEGAGHFVSVWFNVVLRGDNDWLVVGPRSNIQDGSILHTDPGLELVVGAGVTVGHKAMLHGCTIGDNSLIGIGSTVLNGAHIGRDCIVGAHALVTEGKEFPDRSLILGAPAKVVRQLEDGEIPQIGASADHYVENAARYNLSLVPRG
jgi:carbonic anhydrase/acetyltransferase-like protein (isoleucine patch superfamily)